MLGWILSIVGVICLSVLVDILLPEGQTNKYVKGIFSVITLYVIISPLPTLFTGENRLSDSLNFDAVEFETDDEFLKGVANNPFGARENALTHFLHINGYEDATVKYVARVEKPSEVDYINVYLTNESLPENERHNLVTVKVKSLSANFAGLDTEDVRVLYV